MYQTRRSALYAFVTPVSRRPCTYPMICGIQYHCRSWKGVLELTFVDFHSSAGHSLSGSTQSGLIQMPSI